MSLHTKHYIHVPQLKGSTWEQFFWLIFHGLHKHPLLYFMTMLKWSFRTLPMFEPLCSLHTTERLGIKWVIACVPSPTFDTSVGLAACKCVPVDLSSTNHQCQKHAFWHKYDSTDISLIFMIWCTSLKAYHLSIVSFSQKEFQWYSGRLPPKPIWFWVLDIQLSTLCTCILYPTIPVFPVMPWYTLIVEVIATWEKFAALNCQLGI